MSSMALLGGVSFALDDKKVAAQIKNAQLSAAWLPVVFPEEQFNLVTLRDLLAAW